MGDTSLSLWSITQGTLLATFEYFTRDQIMVFSHTNCLYVVQSNNDSMELRVYNMSTDRNTVIRSFPLPSHTLSILLTPDESQILIHTWIDIQVLSLGQFMIDAPRNGFTLAMDLSSDASLFSLATPTEIEIWDARIGQF